MHPSYRSLRVGVMQSEPQCFFRFSVFLYFPTMCFLDKQMYGVAP